MQVKKEIPSETVYRQFLQLLDLYDKVAEDALREA